MNILIDARIRDWVLYPILLSMFMVAIFRYYLTKYMNANKTKDKPSKSSIKEKKNKNVSLMCQKLISGNSLLPEGSFKMRRAFFCKKGTGYLTQLAQVSQPAQNALGLPGGMPAMNPGAMTDMLKNNLTMIVSSMGMFGWISYFFSGFILAKVPFPLTQKFRVMLQRGVEISNLDVKYVSSTSFYFLVLFGQTGLVNLILGSDADDEDLAKLDDMQAMGQMGGPMQMGMMPGQGAGQDFSKILNAERENIELIKHKSILGDFEDNLISKWKASL